jgi:hypothetical protein
MSTRPTLAQLLDWGLPTAGILDQPQPFTTGRSGGKAHAVDYCHRKVTIYPVDVDITTATPARFCTRCVDQTKLARTPEAVAYLDRMCAAHAAVTEAEEAARRIRAGETWPLAAPVLWTRLGQVNRIAHHPDTPAETREFLTAKTADLAVLADTLRAEATTPDQLARARRRRLVELLGKARDGREAGKVTAPEPLVPDTGPVPYLNGNQSWLQDHARDLIQAAWRTWSRAVIDGASFDEAAEQVRDHPHTAGALPTTFDQLPARYTLPDGQACNDPWQVLVDAWRTGAGDELAVIAQQWAGAYTALDTKCATAQDTILLVNLTGEPPLAGTLAAVHGMVRLDDELGLLLASEDLVRWLHRYGLEGRTPRTAAYLVGTGMYTTDPRRTGLSFRHPRLAPAEPGDTPQVLSTAVALSAEVAGSLTERLARAINAARGICA